MGESPEYIRIVQARIADVNGLCHLWLRRLDGAATARYVGYMSIHMIKLVVGVDSLEAFALRQQDERVTFEGRWAVPCWTRFQPKRAEEIVKTGGSIYRVIKNRIVCRHKILGFQMVDVAGEGTFCQIMQHPDIIQTVAVPRKPFQGWRYLEAKDAPKDRGLFRLGQGDEPPAEMADDLRAAGLL